VRESNPSITDGILGEYRRRRIADTVAGCLERKPRYRAHPIDAAHPLHSEACVELRGLGLSGENYYNSRSNPPYYQSIKGSTEHLYARETIANKLLAINVVLEPYDLEIWVFDAWRPVAVQNYFHDVWMPTYLTGLNPSLEGDALWAEVEKYWARGAADGIVDPASPPPHATGAAVDLTVRWKNGAHLYMGSIFDDVTQKANTSFFDAVEPGVSFSDVEARDNRRMLFWLMTTQGFCNNPTEWWHFSWGDQMWAKLTEQSAAQYSGTTPC
jgi:zinc D-Ala-D-Ala dipeptidase